MQNDAFIAFLQSVADQNRAIVSLVSSLTQILQDNLKVKVSVHTQTDEAGNADAINKQYDAMLITDPRETQNIAKTVQPCLQTSIQAVDDTQLTFCKEGYIGCLAGENVTNLADSAVNCNGLAGPNVTGLRSAGDERVNTAALRPDLYSMLLNSAGRTSPT